MRTNWIILGATASALWLISISSNGFAQTKTQTVNSEGVDAYIAKDYITARQKFDQSCTSENDAKGCYHLGMMDEEGLGGTKNEISARELYKKSCASEYSKACNFLGMMYYQGRGGEKDNAAARETFQKACDRKYAESCFNLGILYEDGWNGTKDNVSARQEFQRACSLKYQPACFRGVQTATASPPPSNQPSPPMSQSGEEWCLNGHRHYVKTDGKITYTSACHDHD